MMPILFEKIPLIYILLLSALLLPRIPIIGKFFSVVNTMIHELGHALMALCFEGKVNKIEIFQDSSGATTTQCKSKIANFFVTLVGYPFSAITAYAMFRIYAIGYHEGFLWGISLLFVIVLIFWIRNFYGLLWVLLFTGLNGYLLYLDNTLYFQIATLTYATFTAIDSLYSSIIIFYLSIIHKDKAGDTTLLYKITGIPTFIWGFLFLIFSAWISYLIYKNNPFLFPSIETLL